MAVQIQETRVRRSAREMRTGALGALLAVVGFVLLPTFRTVVIAITGADAGDEYPRPADIPQHGWWGISGAVIFAIIGLGILLAVMSTVDGRSPWARTGTALGVIGAAGYFLSGAGAASMYSFVAANLVHTGADEGAQIAALWAVNIATGAALNIAACGTAAWLAWLGFTGPARAILGGATRIVLILAAALIIAGFTATFLPAQFLFIPAFAALAVALWRRRHPVRETSADD